MGEVNIYGLLETQESMYYVWRCVAFVWRVLTTAIRWSYDPPKVTPPVAK